jgi:hypothetical protein
VLLDSSPQPVISVKAPDWYTARAIAVMDLGVEMYRLHVYYAPKLERRLSTW